MNIRNRLSSCMTLAGAALFCAISTPVFAQWLNLTINDPKAYTKPWTVTLNQVIVLDTELLDYICLENEKSVAHLVGR